MGALSGVDALADTSAFVALEQGRPLRGPLPEALAVSYVTVAELTVGLLVAESAAEQDQRRRTLSQLEQLRPLRVDREVAQVWAEMRETLREAGKSLRTNDSWIAATAVANGLPLVTQDSDYTRIPGLEVIRL